MPIPKREKNHTQGVLIMIDVAHNPTALGHNSREKMCPLKTHQNAETIPVKEATRNCRRKLASKCKSNMKFLIFCWHNTTNFNIMEREHTTQSVENDLWAREGLRHKDNPSDLCPSRCCSISPWQFEFNSEQNEAGYGWGSCRVRDRFGLTWLVPWNAKKRKEKAFGLFAQRRDKGRTCATVSGKRIAAILSLHCAINHREGPVHVCQEALRSQFIFLVGWTNPKCLCECV